MPGGERPKMSEEDLGKVMGICRSLHLTFTEEQILAIIGVLEAGADPSALAEWLAKVDEAKRNTGEASSSVEALERH